MFIIFASLGIILALGSAISGFMCSVIAAPLTPKYANKVREFVKILKPFIWAHRNLTSYFLNNVEQTGTLECKKLDIELHAKLKSAVDTSHNSYKRLSDSELLNFDKEAQIAAKARKWLIVATMFALFSAISQFSGLIITASEKQPTNGSESFEDTIPNQNTSFNNITKISNNANAANAKSRAAD